MNTYKNTSIFIHILVKIKTYSNNSIIILILAQLILISRRI